MASIGIKDVSKIYNGGVTAVSSVSIDIADGEFIVLVGPSGCGKSTLLRMIAGLEDVTSGDIRIDGKRVNDLDPVKRGIAMVFQSYALYPHLTVAENMGFSLKLAGVKRAEIEEKVRPAAEILGLAHLLDRYPRMLSGGQRQRVGLARAIYGDPVFVVLDEPNSSLDEEGDAALAGAIRMMKSRGTTFVVMTHRTSVLAVADKMLVLRDGQMQAFGPRDDVLAALQKAAQQVAGAVQAVA